jgi:hypothetical protein
LGCGGRGEIGSRFIFWGGQDARTMSHWNSLQHWSGHETLSPMNLSEMGSDADRASKETECENTKPSRTTDAEPPKRGGGYESNCPMGYSGAMGYDGGAMRA